MKTCAARMRWARRANGTEGRKFIAELRTRPADKRNLEERQSVEMAEFALIRHDLR